MTTEPTTFPSDEQFRRDIERNWLLYGTVYIVNTPTPRVIPSEAIEVREISKEWAEARVSLQAQVAQLRDHLDKVCDLAVWMSGGLTFDGPEKEQALAYWAKCRDEDLKPALAATADSER